MNSCAYVCRLKHDRPNKNRFAYKIYMFYLDLDEIDLLADRFKLLGKNRWNLLSFYDDDHFLFVRQKGKRDRILARLSITPRNIMLARAPRNGCGRLSGSWASILNSVRSAC